MGLGHYEHHYGDDLGSPNGYWSGYHEDWTASDYRHRYLHDTANEAIILRAMEDGLYLRDTGMDRGDVKFLLITAVVLIAPFFILGTLSFFNLI